jgi:hypothetical protein
MNGGIGFLTFPVCLIRLFLESKRNYISFTEQGNLLYFTIQVNQTILLILENCEIIYQKRMKWKLVVNPFIRARLRTIR